MYVRMRLLEHILSTAGICARPIAHRPETPSSSPARARAQAPHLHQPPLPLHRCYGDHSDRKIAPRVTKITYKNKLIDVVKVLDLNDGKHIERELMLVKVKANSQYREEMKRISDIFRGRVIDVSDNTFTIEITGSSTKLDAYINSLENSAIIETVRTGASGIGRGDRILKI